jgi:sulfur carrier protein ThiS
LEKCELNPHVVLAVRQGKLITEDVILEDGEEIKLVAVISGG